MCGIFGLIFCKEIRIPEQQISELVHTLFKLSESRGKEASGLAFLLSNTIGIYKKPVAASQLLQTDEYRNFLKRSISEYSDPLAENRLPLVVIGHSRLVTNGGQQSHTNNQPAIVNDLAAIHNGIITNDTEIWKRHPSFQQETKLDTEIFLKLFEDSFYQNASYSLALKKTFNEIEGVASIAMLSANTNDLLLTTNNGSLFFCENPQKGVFIFSSEKFILKSCMQKVKWLSEFELPTVSQLNPGNAICINYASYESTHFSLDSDRNVTTTKNPAKRNIQDYSIESSELFENLRNPGEGPYILPASFKDEYPDAARNVSNLRRCTKCILPETMPFIEFDENGICNYCRTEEIPQPLGIDALREAVAPYRKNNGDPDCLVTFSGGRDSSYGVHFICNELQMKPVTYTYDWGMITDLGRRNQMRMCGKLGIENILVSADIAKKRRNIRLNIAAWLRQPDLGTVPLFMAGDKQYFYYANQVGRQTGCEIIVLCENLLETTRFKTGFCGISPHFGSPHTYSLSLGDKFRLLGYYGKKFATNPKYINASLIDTLSAYVSYYFIPHNYLNLYNYIQWDEQIINETLKQYNWETAADTTSTWRIGDGTASFYNFIYYMLAGFTENDTFRSNQIRAGFLSRDQALTMVNEENVPRYNSIQWYCDIIGLDFNSTISTINRAPRLYNVE